MSNTPKSDSEDWTEWEVLSVQSHAAKSQKSPKITSQKINIDKTTSNSSNSSNESFSQVQISNNNNNNKNNNNNNNNPNYNGNMYTCPSNLMTSQLVSNHDDEKQSVLWIDNKQQQQQQQIPSLHMPQQQPPQRQQQYYHPNNNMNNMNINPYMNMNNNLGLYQQQQQLVQQQQQQLVQQQQQLSQLTPPKIPIQVPSQPIVQVQMPSQSQQGGLFWNPFNFNYQPQVPPPQVQVQQVPLQPMQTSPLLSNDNNLNNNNNINKKKEDIISPLLSLNALDLNIKPDTNNNKKNNNSNNNNNNNKKKEEESLEQDIDHNNVWKCNNCNCYHDESHRFCPSCGIKNSLLDNIKQDNPKDKENELNIVFKQIISGVNYDPNEKRQCGWILTNNSNNKINGIAKLNYIGGNDEIKIEHESFYDIHLNKNEDLYILIDVIAPSIVGKYTCFYQLILDNGINFGPILELNVNVQKQFDDKKESKIEQIIKMGFNNRQQVIHCLQKHKWVVDHALNELLGQ